MTDIRSNTDSLSFSLNLDAFAQGLGTPQDVGILRRVLAFFPDSTAWSRSNSRDCPVHAAPRTLWCALIDASVAEIGEYQNMRPAIQQVRWSVFQLWNNPEHIAHPLTDVNAAPATTFAQIRQIVSNALVRLEKGATPAKSVQQRFTYTRTPQGPLDLIVDYPADWKPSDARPAIVFFFGGGWSIGSVEQFSRHAAYFTTRGMVAIRADYRIASTHHTEPDAAVQDGLSAMSWVRGHVQELGIDPDRIVASGGSSGGHLAACTVQCPTAGPIRDNGTLSSRPNALILFNPVVDYGGLEQLPAPFSTGFRSFPGLMRDTALQNRISPLAHLERGNPPTLLLFGTADPLFTSGRLYADKLKTVGVRAELFTADGAGHGFFNSSPWYERTVYRADEFLQSLGYIQGPPTIAHQ